MAIVNTENSVALQGTITNDDQAVMYALFFEKTDNDELSQYIETIVVDDYQVKYTVMNFPQALNDSDEHYQTLDNFEGQDLKDFQKFIPQTVTNEFQMYQYGIDKHAGTQIVNGNYANTYSTLSSITKQGIDARAKRDYFINLFYGKKSVTVVDGKTLYKAGGLKSYIKNVIDLTLTPDKDLSYDDIEYAMSLIKINAGGDINSTRIAVMNSLTYSYFRKFVKVEQSEVDKTGRVYTEVVKQVNTVSGTLTIVVSERIRNGDIFILNSDNVKNAMKRYHFNGKTDIIHVDKLAITGAAEKEQVLFHASHVLGSDVEHAYIQIPINKIQLPAYEEETVVGG